MFSTGSLDNNAELTRFKVNTGAENLMENFNSLVFDYEIVILEQDAYVRFSEITPSNPFANYNITVDNVSVDLINGSRSYNNYISVERLLTGKFALNILGAISYYFNVDTKTYTVSTLIDASSVNINITSNGTT